MCWLSSLAFSPKSHRYYVYGGTSCKVSLCSLLGFFQPMDYYAYLVSKGLAAYEFNLKKRGMEIEIKIDKWEQFLSNGRYGLASPQNAELSVTKMDMENFLCGKKQQDSKRSRHYLIRLGNKDSNTYAPKISQQEVFLPTIPGWRLKQRYF